MSAEPVVQPDPHKEFVEKFTKEVELAMHGLAEKYRGQINDIAIVVNWTPENIQKPYPKLVIETMRDVSKPDFDPVRQALELSDLLNMGSTHIVRQTLFNVLQQNNALRTQMQEKAQSSQLILPGMDGAPQK